MGLVIHPMCLAEAVIDSSYSVWGMNPGTPQKGPCIGYLILGAATPIVVDTGLGRIDGPFMQTPDQTLAANLARHDVAPEDVGLIIHTHLHGDHAGQDDLMPNARIVVQREELEYAPKPLFPSFIYDQEAIAKLTGPLRDRIDLIDGDQDILTGIRGVKTGGHSPGHQMIYVTVDSGQAIIVGDNVQLVDPGLTQRMPPGYWTNLFEVMAALDRIEQDADHVLPMHDPEVFVRYPAGVR